MQYVAGVGLPTGAPLAVAVIAAVALFVAPDIDVRKEAKKRRAEFTEQLSIFLDLVSLKMAGHAAAAAALPEAAQRGGGWPMMLSATPCSARGCPGRTSGMPSVSSVNASPCRTYASWAR